MNSCTHLGYSNYMFRVFLSSENGSTGHLSLFNGEPIYINDWLYCRQDYYVRLYNFPFFKKFFAGI